MENSRPYTVNFPTPDGEFEKRYPALLKVPYIRYPDLSYHRLASRYLVERAVHGWVPEHRKGFGAKTHLARKSLKTYAEALIDFLQYSDRFKVNLKTCGYSKDIFNGYQKRMLAGNWPLTDKGVHGSTPESRVQQACEYLSWMAEKGFREPFQIPYESVSVNLLGHHHAAWNSSTKVTRARVGRLQRHETALTMPTDEAVRSWLREIRTRYEPVWELMCESVPLTAMRREEIVCLRVDSLPEDKKLWRIPNIFAPETHQKVLISIVYGCKGPDYGVDRHGDKIGKERTIEVPLPLANKWHEYRRTSRNEAFAKWMAGSNGSARKRRAEQCVHLFLDPTTGARITGKRLYDIWTSVERPHGWHPRAGRHWWACSTLWRAVSKWLGPNSRAVITDDMTDQISLNVIDLVIRPQLGHTSKETTMIYLRWVRSMVSIPLSLDANEGWQVSAQASLLLPTDFV
jgi:integrase